MLSRWKTWIAGHFGHRTTRRRHAAPRIRGQMESLESRNVLSATIGVLSLDVVAVHFEPTSITVFATASFELVAPPIPSFQPFSNIALGQPVGHGPQSLIGFNGAKTNHGSDPWFDNLYSRIHSLPYEMPRSAPAGGGSSIDNEVSSGGVTETILSGSGPNGAYEQPVGAQAPALPTNGERTSDGRVQRAVASEPTFGPLRINVANAYQSSAMAMTPAMTSFDSLDRNSFGSHDAAFESLSSDSLLLAVDGEMDDDDSLLGDPNEELESLQDDNRHDSTADESIADTLAEPLDALDRERAAVDAVLAELHEIRLTDGSAESADTQSYRSQSETNSREFAERFFFSPGTDTTQSPFQSPHDASAGGMILLAATGDANSSAYDLGPVIPTSAEVGITSLAVEAPVGLYQAVDVGVRPTQAAAAQNLSTVQPGTKTQTDVSAENAPAKKSEQPPA